MQMRLGVIWAVLAVAATVALSAPAAAPRPSADPYQAGLAFAACMRAHGVSPGPGSERRLQPDSRARASLARGRHGEGPCRGQSLLQVFEASRQHEAALRKGEGPGEAGPRASTHVCAWLWLHARRSRRSEPQSGPCLLWFQAKRECVAALAHDDEGGTHLRTACPTREEDLRDHRNRSRPGLSRPGSAAGPPLQDVDLLAVVRVRDSTYVHLAGVVFRDEAQRLEQRLLRCHGAQTDANVERTFFRIVSRLSESDVISDDASPPDTRSAARSGLEPTNQLF